MYPGFETQRSRQQKPKIGLSMPQLNCHLPSFLLKRFKTFGFQKTGAPDVPLNEIDIERQLAMQKKLEWVTYEPPKKNSQDDPQNM